MIDLDQIACRGGEYVCAALGTKCAIFAIYGTLITGAIRLKAQ